MVKKIGSIDRVSHRKTRSDLGKKRTRYKNKPCKHRKNSYYYKRETGNKKSIIIWAWVRKEMSKDGYRNWKKFWWLKARLWKEVTDLKSTKPLRVETSDINTKEKFERFIANRYWSGDNGKSVKYVIMGVSRGKTKTHRQWVKICTITVKNTPEGNIGTMVENKRLSKYWWWKR